MRIVEIWVDIKGYEGLYEISNMGNVRARDRYRNWKRGKRLVKGRMLKLQDNSQGYLRAYLTDRNGVKRKVFVHRLVALHFVENECPEVYTIVNHLDANPHNNRAYNLEWTTMKGNSDHAVSLGHLKKTDDWKKNIKAGKKNATPVIGTNIKTGEEIRFEYMNDCKEQGFEPSCVHGCCQGQRKTHKGYYWRYSE